MTDIRFFDEQSEQSKVKASLVQKYFWAWANVILGALARNKYVTDKKIVYIDLFSGPGRYKDGAMSTPLLVLQQAINDPRISPYLVTLFNDIDQNNTSTLKNEIAKLQNISSLKHPPQVYNEVVSDDIVKWFNSTSLAPTLFFVDPWGYKGLSLQLINSVLKNWGCDCIFFFNYNRISMGIKNPCVRPHMEALFESRYEQVVARVENTTPEQREAVIIDELCEALNEMGGCQHYILPFRFRNELGNRTSHHLIFVSKDFKGYEIMKEIMAKESSTENQGVASFEYNQVDECCPFLFQFNRPLDDLKNDLLVHFAGKTLTAIDIYKEHCIGTPFIKKNYKDVLAQLDDDGIIQIQTSNGKKRRAGTFPDNIMVTFPER